MNKTDPKKSQGTYLLLWAILMFYWQPYCWQYIGLTLMWVTESAVASLRHVPVHFFALLPNLTQPVPWLNVWLFRRYGQHTFPPYEKASNAMWTKNMLLQLSATLSAVIGTQS
jgi:hypothetical protein